MNTLNLTRINEKSAYEVWQTSEGDFNFQTDFDVLYRISFRIEQTIWSDGAYEFSIINQNQKSSPNDKKVRETIFIIIEEFFASNPDILLYQCETGDNRQSMRDRLFLRWFKEYEHSDRYYIKVSTITAEKVTNYTAMIVQKTNPQLETIIKDFDEFIGFFQNKPQ
ncbi:MAG: hypothetical protein J6W38_04670 [Prevotella sp.]|jgi:hypothetical protein|nr:hypothetical protein [Prevotella sp.]